MIKNILQDKERNLLGLRIHSLTEEELFNILTKIIFKSDYSILKESLIIYGFSANILSRLRSIPEFVTFFKKMDIIIADGQGIPILARMFNVDISERIGIVNLSNNLLEVANQNGLRVFLLGSTQEINMVACNNIKKKYKEIKDCEGLHGYFDSSDDLKIVDKISFYKPDILFIGISSPIKEKFALKYKDRLNAKLIIPCGGWIDVVAGKVKRPRFISKSFPITWFVRFIQEPKRMFGPIIMTMLDTILIILPVLYVKHILGIEKNPSIIKFLGLEDKIQKENFN